jgi:hypothetical protein
MRDAVSPTAVHYLCRHLQQPLYFYLCPLYILVPDGWQHQHAASLSLEGGTLAQVYEQ